MRLGQAEFQTPQKEEKRKKEITAVCGTAKERVYPRMKSTRDAGRGWVIRVRREFQIMLEPPLSGR